MARLNTLIFLAVVALSVVALIDCMLTERSRLRSFPRGAWAVLILLCPVFGAVAWFRAGRNVPGEPAQALTVPAGRPVGPEDDPEFVRMLADAIRER